MKISNHIVFLFLISFSWGQTWQWTGRTHGELNWSTIETEHFRIHYHQGIEEIAREGVSIAEQVRPTLLKQMDLEDIPIIDIIFTTEDEIMNGFAMWTNTTFIWVDQNDAAIWLEDEKWLFQVLSHELQHIVFFNRIHTWLPEPWSFLVSKTPGWVVEGLAEYETERWRPYRADISHKYHILKNKIKEMDPHHDGYSKLLYWSDRFGDSTIVNTLSEQNKLGLFKFEKSFKKHTGITVDQFNEDWRRHMNTYYYGYRAQKEAIEEIGKVVTLPIKKLQSFSFYSDSTRIAITGKDDEDQFDQSLYIIQRDTVKEKKQRIKRKKALEKKAKKEVKTKKKKKGLFAKFFSKDEEKNKKPKPIIIWDKNEVDYGIFHKAFNWSPDGRKLAYAKYHFGENQSMINDIKVYNLDTEKSTWLTHSFRALYPDWSPDGEQIVFVAHRNSIANLYTMNGDGSNQQEITHFDYDTQIIGPQFSPDGESIVFAMADKKANLDLFLLTMDTGKMRRLTDDPAADYGPVWHPNGLFVTYTSHAGSTPNLHTINITTGESNQVTDVGDAVWAAQWSVIDSSVMAMTLPDVDTVRIVNVDPYREITTKDLVLREKYTSWRKAEPSALLTGVDPEKEVKIVKTHRYQPRLGFKQLTSLVLPLGNSVLGFTQWADAMTRHIFTGVALADFSQTKTHRFLLQYTNAMGGPMWGINVSSLFDLKTKPYDRSKWGLLEENNSIALWSYLPYNTGKSFSENHVFGWQLKITDRKASIITDVNESTDEIQVINTNTKRYLPVPVSGKEGLFSINYTFKSKRPHKQNIMIPKQGFGFNVQLDAASSEIFGDFDFTKVTTDAFFNWLPHKKSPAVLFGRLKTVAMLGNNPLPQDIPAITNDTPIYIGGVNILGVDEVVHLRGWDDWRLGDRLVFGTVEPRIGNEKFIFAGFLDFGNAWYSDKNVEDWLFTGGYELRMNLLGLVIAYGTAQDFNRWRDGEWPVNYIRLSLVNPF
ncbi:MAG: hypothetical protein ACE5D0_03260 [Fidelibacterota bacterium]